MRRTLVQLAILLGGCTPLVAVGCSTDAEGSFTLRLEAPGVVPEAVDQVDIVLRPSSLDQRFRSVADGTHFDGTVFSRVTAAGEFFIRLEAAFVRERAENRDSTLVLDVPIFSTDDTDDPNVANPSVEVAFRQGETSIAEAQRFVEWPLPADVVTTLTVRCLPDRRPECANEVSREMR